MKVVKKIISKAVPLRRSDIDTDQIIPSDWLKKVNREGFGEGLFGEWREDPSFVLNQEKYNGAKILIAGPNFGTGSSREHAVWALMDYGFEAVISPKFGDIFKTNSTKTGLVTCSVSQEFYEQLSSSVEENPDLKIEIDIEKRLVSAKTLSLLENFPIDDFVQYRLLNGLDDIDLTLKLDNKIKDFEDARPSWKPKVTC